MAKPNAEEYEQIAAVAARHPKFVAWLTQWRDTELKLLPFVIANTQVAQGRVQLLTEITKMLSEAPEKINKQER